jgi:CheY-like chemotaxis protein/anti-sigma regulatory factor (Ser/Thr protein kinase)
MTPTNPMRANSPSLSVSFAPVNQPYLLVVDDDRITRAMITGMLEKSGVKVADVGSGREALAKMKKEAAEIDAIILDREMPEMNGLDVVAMMKGDPELSTIPVIMYTGSGEAAQIQQGIDAGVFYYLVKPASEELLNSVVTSALRDRDQRRVMLDQLKRSGAVMRTMRSCQLSVRTVKEAEDGAVFLASCYEQPDRVVTGLLELLLNAVEHGNLGITFEEKTQLLHDNTWAEEIARRQNAPENKDKTVDVIFQRQGETLLVQITDKGKGFDWRRYWDIDPARATAGHGRGIARARLLAFDKLAYNDSGNQVTAVVQAASSKNSLKW